jgi:methylmalonyl-CoA decarboxylase subunit alpha
MPIPGIFVYTGGILYERTKTMGNREHLQALRSLREAVLAGDGERVAAQHAAGKGTARERITKIFDAGSFVELDTLARNGGAVTGYGTVHGRPAYCYAQDLAVSGGAMSRAQSVKAAKLLEMARMTGAPVITLCDSAGAKVVEGAVALAAYGEILAKMTRLSGVCPMLCAVMGPCRGTATLFTQLADITIQVNKTSELLLSSPLVLDAAAQALGGADAMGAQGGIALAAGNEDEACALIVSLLDMLPSCSAEDAPLLERDDLNRKLAACDASDGLTLAAELADNGQLIALSPAYGKRCHTLLARVGGRSAGIMATNHTLDDGRLDAAACAKAARFVRFCDCYHMPVITLVHSDGLAVMEKDQQAGLMRSAGQMFYAYAEATAPKLAVVTGNAVGMAYTALCARPMADMTYAWPEAFIAPLTADTAARTLYTERVKAGEASVEDQRAALEAEYRAESGALAAAAAGLADDVIDPADTRKLLIAAMEMLDSKRDSNPPKKHGNMPI